MTSYVDSAQNLLSPDTELISFLIYRKKKKKKGVCVCFPQKAFGNRGALFSSSLSLTSAAAPGMWLFILCLQKTHPSYSSSSPSFWHQGLVSWKTKIFHEPGQGWGGDSFRMILIRSTQPRSLIYTVHRRVHVPMRNYCCLWSDRQSDPTTQAIMWVIGSVCKHRWSFVCSPATHLLL